MIFRALVKQPQLGFEFGQHLGTMLALALGFGRIEAQHIAFAPFAGADPDLLDLQVVGDLAVATWSAQPGRWQGFDPRVHTDMAMMGGRVQLECSPTAPQTSVSGTVSGRSEKARISGL